MESVVLLDHTRYRACDAFLTYDWDGNNTIWGGGKFLIIDGVLVIALVSDHSHIYALHKTWESPINDELKAAFAGWVSHAWAQRQSVREITGAGEFNKEGQVTGWKSTCFKKETAENLRQAVQEQFDRLFQAGALNTPALESW